MQPRNRLAMISAALGVSFVISGVAAAAADAASDSARIEAARALIARARFCALITVDDKGQPQARTMDPAPPDAQMVVWLATNPGTRKVKQIERARRVTLYYFDSGSPGYVTLIGTARVVSDPAAKKEHWLAKWDHFFPGGPEGATMFEVTPHRLEIVDPAHGVVGDPKTWLPPSVDFKWLPQYPR